MTKFKILIICLMISSVAIAQKSPRKQAQGEISGSAIVVDYGAPSVKGRTIWGGLEKYGKVWRAGANENTTISFSKDVTVGEKSLKAGKYGFFMIPNESGDWVIIFSTKNDGWGAYAYKEAEDALRLNIAPQTASNTQEMLEYSVGDSSIEFAWDKARISIPVK